QRAGAFRLISRESGASNAAGGLTTGRCDARGMKTPRRSCYCNLHFASVALRLGGWRDAKFKLRIRARVAVERSKDEARLRFVVGGRWRRDDRSAVSGDQYVVAADHGYTCYTDAGREQRPDAEDDVHRT